MKKLLILSITILLFGCANDSVNEANARSYRVEIEALSSLQKQNGNLYVIHPESEELLKKNELFYQKLIEQTELIFALKGWKKIENEKLADQIIYLNYETKQFAGIVRQIEPIVGYDPFISSRWRGPRVGSHLSYYGPHYGVGLSGYYERERLQNFFLTRVSLKGKDKQGQSLWFVSALVNLPYDPDLSDIKRLIGTASGYIGQSFEKKILINVPFPQ